MICRLCGQHFCYVCGGEWSKHGNAFYNCRFAPPTAENSADRTEYQWQETCTDHYLRMLRDCPRLPEVGRRVGELSDHFELALELGLAHRCAISIADARRVLGHCYAA